MNPNDTQNSAAQSTATRQNLQNLQNLNGGNQGSPNIGSQNSPSGSYSLSLSLSRKRAMSQI